MAKNCNFIEKLRELGLRPTKQRVKICELLFNREKTFHFTINDLVKMISEEMDEKISLATVYNTVHAFQKKGHLKENRIRGTRAAIEKGNVRPVSWGTKGEGAGKPSGAGAIAAPLETEKESCKLNLS